MCCTCTYTHVFYVHVLVLVSFITLCLLTGTTIWFSYPQPGDIVPNNVAIAVLTTVNEIRCYSPDTTSSSTLTSITTPSGPNSLSFTSSVAGKLVKSGGTSISDVNVGVYTCTYTNGDVSSEANFAVYSRDREGESKRRLLEYCV